MNFAEFTTELQRVRGCVAFVRFWNWQKASQDSGISVSANQE